MPNENNSSDEDRFARQDQRPYSGWASIVVIAIVVIVVGVFFTYSLDVDPKQTAPALCEGRLHGVIEI
jgi:hypothetical protein